jgi:integrase/recombinase XerC
MVAFFLQYIRFQKRRSPHTILAYENDLSQFSDWLQAESGISPEQAGKHQIRQWIMVLSEQDYSPVSINRKLSSLRAFYDFLRREGKIESHPMSALRSLKKPKRLPVWVKEKSMVNLFEQVEFPSGFSGLRDKLVMELLYGTGMRLSELTGLRFDSVSFSDSRILVTGKRNKQRWIPLHENLMILISEYQKLLLTLPKKDSSEILILTDKGKPAYPVFIERLVNKYLGLVTTEKKKSPHVLRHTFASHLLNAGADIGAIRDLLGHSSLAATQVYTHNSVAKLKQAYQLAHPRAKTKSST